MRSSSTLASLRTTRRRRGTSTAPSTTRPPSSQCAGATPGATGCPTAHLRTHDPSSRRDFLCLHGSRRPLETPSGRAATTLHATNALSADGSAPNATKNARGARRTRARTAAPPARRQGSTGRVVGMTMTKMTTASMTILAGAASRDAGPGARTVASRTPRGVSARGHRAAGTPSSKVTGARSAPLTTSSTAACAPSNARCQPLPTLLPCRPTYFARPS